MKYLSLLVLGTLIFFSGCASVGKKIDQSRLSELEKGVSTRTDVERVFGAPTEVGFGDNGAVVMKYIYTRATAKGVNFVPVVGLFAGGANTRTQQLNFLLDENNVVQNWVWNDAEGEMSTGLISK